MMNSLSRFHCWLWFEASARLLRQHPAPQLRLGTQVTALWWGLFLVPFLGHFALLLLWPHLLAGLIQGGVALSEPDGEGGKGLLATIGDDRVNARLALVGLLFLTLALLALTLVVAMIESLARDWPWALFLIVLLLWALGFLLALTVPLILFEDRGLWQALQRVMQALREDTLALLGLAATLGVLNLVSLLSLGLAWPLVAPLSANALYYWYEDLEQ